MPSSSSSDDKLPWTAWQPKSTKSGKPFDLPSLDPSAKPFSTGNTA